MNQQRRADTSDVIWELTGKTGKPLTCVLFTAPHGVTVLTVILGPDRLFSDFFQREADALGRAEFLRQDFLASGWAKAFHRDER